MKTAIKQWTLEIIAASRNEFETFIKDIPKTEHQKLGELKTWSAKDEVTHLSYWIELFVKNIKARRRNKRLTNTKDYLAMNDKAWGQRKDWSWAEVEEKLFKTFAELEKQIKALTLSN
ncbi:MAG: ClbS/DfsB family four-helix bundle protein [Trueperaceae bacterium]